MSPILSSRSKRIPELDGLRAFAVISVVLFHMCNFAGSIPRGPYWIAAIVPFLGLGGVSVFFIISGYIITTLLIRENTSSGQVSLKAFYIRRFLRIVPPFVIYLLGLLVFRALGTIQVSNSNIFWSALFLGDTALLDSQAWFVAHTWSLSVEEQFYVIFPPFLCIIVGFRARLVILAMGVLYGLCLVSFKLSHELALRVTPQWISLSSLYHFRHIIVGVVLATNGTSFLSFLSNRSRTWPLSFALFAFMLFMLQQIQVPSIVSVLIAAIEPCFCGLFVMWFMQNPDRCRILRVPIIQWIGACSYSIYLWQQLFTAPAHFYFGWEFGQSLLSIIAILFFATASFYLIEKPSIRLGLALSRKIQNPNSDRGDSI